MKQKPNKFTVLWFYSLLSAKKRRYRTIPKRSPGLIFAQLPDHVFLFSGGPIYRGIIFRWKFAFQKFGVTIYFERKLRLNIFECE